MQSVWFATCGLGSRVAPNHPCRPAPLYAPRHINAWMCRIYCHKVIKLSDAVQPLPRQETLFVHGVSPSFLQVGSVPVCLCPLGEA